MQPDTPRAAPTTAPIIPSRRSAVSRFFLVPTADRRRLRIHWPRVSGAVLCGCLTVWFTVGTIAFAVLHHYRGITPVRFVDVIWPSRWPHVRLARGEHDISTALIHVHRRQYRDAFTYLNRGLARAPAHLAARKLLVDLLLANNQPDLAQTTLLVGIAFHAANPDYLGLTFRFLFERDKDHDALELARKLLAQSPVAPVTYEIATLAAATAYFQRGNYDSAEEFLRRLPRFDHSPDAQLLVAKIDWERGYRDLGLLRLRALANQHPHNPGICEELVRRLQHLELHDEARRHTLAFQIANPGLARPRLDLLHAYRQSNDTVAIQRESDQILQDFPSNHAILLALGEFAARFGDNTLAERLCAHVRHHHLPVAPFDLLRIETLLARRDYAAVLATTRSLLRDEPQQSPGQTLVLESLQAVAQLGAGDRDAARAFISRLVVEPGIRAQNLLAIANRFAELDAADEACRLLARAVALDPQNQRALTRLIELELNLNRTDDLPAHLLRFVGMRKPSPDILRVAHHKLGSDLFLFSPGRAAALDALQTALEKSSAALAHR